MKSGLNIICQEIFQKFPNTILHVDLKGDNPQLIEETNGLVKAYKREHITVKIKELIFLVTLIIRFGDL